MSDVMGRWSLVARGRISNGKIGCLEFPRMEIAMKEEGVSCCDTPDARWIICSFLLSASIFDMM